MYLAESSSNDPSMLFFLTDKNTFNAAMDHSLNVSNVILSRSTDTASPKGVWSLNNRFDTCFAIVALTSRGFVYSNLTQRLVLALPLPSKCYYI